MRTIISALFTLVLVLGLTVPAFSAPSSPAPAAPEAQASRVLSQPVAGGKVDLNTATAEELVTLKGIGPAKAKAIMQYRTDHGGFGTVDELLNVRGIGQKTLDKLRDSLTAGKK